MSIEKSANLRRVLADAIIAVRDKKMDPATANDIAKLAGRLNDNYFAEVALRKSLKECDVAVPQLGQIPIGE